MSTIEPIAMRFHSGRSGLPTTILLTLRVRAKARISSLIRAPVRVWVSAPSCSASRMVWATRSRAA